MQKIKDIFYDTNDLIVALLIIVLATLLIRDRIEVILDYPNANALGTVYEENGDAIAGETDADAGGDAANAETDGDANAGGEEGTETGDAAGDAASGGAEANGTADGETPEAPPTGEPVKYSLYIAYGETAAQIAQKLLDSGLIENNNEFYDALIEADAATRLQAGSFIITEGATPAEIVGILTGR
ncbi:MAG: endolytic transglycosylase MltG [Clostridiales Family XIII bacterium]|jgi:hypothetical protein|nr:endolytic transglycosylase MltG [Clostridiales Family XIII bacterium]